MHNKEYLVGRQIGNYCLEAYIDNGSYGSVYRARHHIFSEDPPVALKLMHAYLDAAEDQELFFQEARLLRRLKHPAILPVIDVGFDHGRPYLVTAYAVGGSLRDLLRQRNGQPLSLSEALRILLSIGQALSHAHRQNVFHRDLKPENILFNEQGEALLADFGIALSFASAHTHHAGQGGTPAYMAPEQFEGLVSPKSDQYALGCLGYELLTGRRPFDLGQAGLETMWFQHAHVVPQPPTRLNAAVPLPVEQALLRALAKERGARYKDIAAFLRDLSEPFFSESSQHAQVTISAGQRSHGERAVAIRSGGLRLRGEVLYDDGRYQEALLFFRRAVSLDASDIYAHERLGSTFFALERYQEALEAYERALELDGSNAVYEVDRAKALVALRRENQALEACARAQQLDPLNAAAYGVQGNIYLEMGLDEGALRCYEQAIERDPRNPRYHRYRGDALRWLGRDEEALSAYEQALALKPVSREACVALFRAQAHTYYNLGHFLDALELYCRVLELEADIDTYFYKGQTLYQMQHYEEALTAFDQALSLGTDSAPVHAHRGYALYQLQRYEEALDALDSSLALDADDAALYNVEGNILYSLGRYTEALTRYERAVELVPENKNYQENRSSTLEKLPTLSR
jgi:serine/threonine protein kinase/cytochrome c-type biogenesis protein CcmH/NrfG